MTPPSYLAYVEWRNAVDVSDLLRNVTVPALVLNRRRPYFAGIAGGVASAIKNARLYTAPTDGVVPGRWLAEETAVVEEFLGVNALASSSDSNQPAVADGLVHLTQRELDVLALLVAGRSNREIADDLVLSERTVARHIANMYQKAAVHGRAEITAYALKHRLV
jgi:DNA-binding NarL/FixJ family response regulator